MSKFVLPEKWKLIWDCEETFNQSAKYHIPRYDYYQNSGITSDHRYISYTDKKSLYSEYQEITYNQFVNYVLSKKENHKHLIKLLKLNKIT